MPAERTRGPAGAVGTRRSSSRLAGAYLRLTAVRARARALGEAAFDGIWLGLLDRDALAAVDEAFYKSATEPVSGRPAYYHDPAHILQGLHDWERSVAERFPPGARVVVTSAGAGREVHALTAMGFEVIGFEPNADLLEAGLGVLADPRTLRQSLRDAFPADAPQADVVVVGWGSYMLIKGGSARISLLRGAAEAIPAGGLVLVSIFRAPLGELLHHRAPDCESRSSPDWRRPA